MMAGSACRDVSRFGYIICMMTIEPGRARSSTCAVIASGLAAMAGSDSGSMSHVTLVRPCRDRYHGSASSFLR